jgi:hypothetical protein
MAYVAVRTSAGVDSIGSAFHVGEGVFVTARHVVENVKIVQVKPTRPLRRPIREEFPDYPDEAAKKFAEIAGQKPTWPVFQSPLTISRGPFYLPDSAIDVAAFATKGLHPATPYVPLGRHLDDWIYRAEFVMSDAVILGYPPIPLTNDPYLIAARAEINAVIQTRYSSKVHFILSAMARGGFSGGLALSEHEFVLGLVTESLARDHAAAELGFMAVLSVESIYECLAAAKLLPACQKTGWDDFWNTKHWIFVTEVPAGHREGRATISLCDDGQQVYVELDCREPEAMKRGLAAVMESAPSGRIAIARHDELRARFSFFPYDKDTVALAERAAGIACSAMIQFGYKKEVHVRPGGQS